MTNPRTLAHRGTVNAAGFYFDTAVETGLRPVADTKRRILALWTPGSVVYRLPHGFVLRLPTTTTVSAAAAPGVPLVLVGGLLCAAPLLPDEIDGLSAPAGSLVLLRGGVASAYALSPAIEEDPAAWLSVADFEIVSVRSLGAPPAPPVLVAPPTPFDSRAKLGGVPPAVPEMEMVLESLRRPLTGPVQSTKTEGQGLSLLRRFSGAGTDTGTGAAPGEKRSLMSDLRRLAAQLVLRADLAHRIGRKQAEYMVRMMDMFERGDLDAALRHAIPLSGKPGTGDATPALSVPKPRTDLTINVSPPGEARSLPFGPAVFDDLRSLYRKAFERLERDGRIEEAAFVLADLLQVSGEAVAFLEKHDKLQLAAEMAEARDLFPCLIVRQWFLAGNTDRAVRIARRTGAFADAVGRLEKSRPNDAKTLRTLWAQSLARAGDWAGAVDVVWSVLEARSVARAWAERAMAEGGVSGARMLARLLALEESNGDNSLREKAILLLDSEDTDSAAEREAFTDTLLTGAAAPATAVLARAAVRSVWRDSASGMRRVPPTDPKKWLNFAGDAALRADLPPLPKLLPRPRLGDSGTEPLDLQIAAGDTGTVPIMDAALLPNGRCLLAMGESGARLLARDGRTVAHFDAPAHRLVVSDTGGHALLLAPRGDIWTVSRLDLATRRATHWTNAALTAFAPDYDGSLWLAGIGDAFIALDATAEKFEALWRTPNVPGVIRNIARSKTQASFLVQDKRTTDTWGKPTEATESWERWVYELPSLILRHRDFVPFAEGDSLQAAPPFPAVSPAGYALERVPLRQPGYDPNIAEGYRLFPPPGPGPDAAPLARLSPIGDLLPGALSDTWAFVPVRTDAGIKVQVEIIATTQVCIRFTLGGATKVSARFTDETLTVADDRGRLLVLSLTDGGVLRNLRVR